MKPPMWEIDEPGSMTSSGVSSKAAAQVAKIAASEPWVWVTPLAGPVLPEVKKIAAGSLGRGTGRGLAGGGWAASAS